MPQAKLRDISLYYQIHGSGDPLLLIGGLSSDNYSWSGVIRGFAAHFHVIVFDNAGCGRSGIRRTGCTIRAMAHDAIKLLDFLRIKKAHIIGHSMGGYIAQELAINYPQRVGRLILASTAAVSSSRNNILFEDMYIKLKEEGHSEAWLKRWNFWLFSPRLLHDSTFIKAFISNSLKYPYLQKPAGFKSQIAAIAAFDARARMAAIKAETLILEGKHDILITPEEAEMSAKGILKSTFRILDGAAHAIHLEDPKLFVTAVLGFLNHK